MKHFFHHSSVLQQTADTRAWTNRIIKTRQGPRQQTASEHQSAHVFESEEIWGKQQQEQTEQTLLFLHTSSFLFCLVWMSSSYTPPSFRLNFSFWVCNAQQRSTAQLKIIKWTVDRRETSPRTSHIQFAASVIKASLPVSSKQTTKMLINSM